MLSQRSLADINNHDFENIAGHGIHDEQHTVVLGQMPDRWSMGNIRMDQYHVIIMLYELSLENNDNIY